MKQLLGRAAILPLAFGILLADSPSPISGPYVKACPKGVPCKSTADLLTLKERPDGKIAVTVRLIYAAGHTCQLDGAAVRAGDVVTLTADGLDDDKPCKLQITLNGDKATLNDVDGHCQPVYCGTRGTFQGVTFTKASKRK